MKKVLLYTLLGVGMLTSCDMNEAPYGTISDENAIESVNDAARFRNLFYSYFRSQTSGSLITNAELEADMFNGITINGNRGGTVANALILPGSSEVSSLWAGCYTRIANCNYFLEKANIVLERTTDANEALTLQRYIGDAHFTRAFNYWVLFDKFCQLYSADKGDTPALGIPLVTVYNPSGDRSTYPGRSTMNETLKLIKEDLDIAYNNLKAFEAKDQSAVVPMSPYLCSYTVEALQARIALATGDNKTAIAKANSVINSKVYTLANLDNYDDMWYNDTNNEIIFRPFASATELGGLNATGTAWISIYSDRADYIPGWDALNLYYVGDVRFDSFFEVRGLSVEGAKYNCYNFVKFPGNPALKPTASANIMNMPKPFRLSEQYLILAEAAYNDGQGDIANSALNTLRKNRIEGWTDVTFSGTGLRDEIREERAKELIGEGFRLSDLRRWGLGFKRSYDYPAAWGLDNILVKAGLAIEFAPNDYRYTWPVPSDEIKVNPQMTGQQNPGY